MSENSHEICYWTENKSLFSLTNVINVSGNESYEA